MTQAAIRVVGLRLSAAGDEGPATDRLLQELSRLRLPRPALLYSPPYASTEADLAADAKRLNGLQFEGAGSTLDLSSSGAIIWADVGFWIRPDGTVADPEVLRGSRDRAWTRPYLHQVSGRRYSAAEGSSDGLGVYRVERFTLRGNYSGVDSLIRRRGGPRSLEVLDLTAPNARVTAPN